MKVILKQNPELDFFYRYNFQAEIPIKQDDFEPVKGVELFEKTQDGMVASDIRELYHKKELGISNQNFESHLKEDLKNAIIAHDLTFPIKKSQKVEVVLSINMSQKRLNQVDVNLLTKSILDCLTGIILEDNSQIINLLARKHIYENDSQNGFMMGIRKIKDNQADSWFSDVQFAYFEYKEY